MASQSLFVLVQSLMANLICYRPDKNVNFFVLIPVLQAELISYIEGNVDNGTYNYV